MRLLAFFAGMVALSPACSHEWDALNPRLGEGSGGDGLGGAGAPTSSATSGTSTPSSSSGGGSGGSSSTGSSSTTTTTSSTDSSSSTGGGGAGTTASSSVSSGGGGPFVVEYAATIAECLDPGDPDPDFCEERTGENLFAVDLQSEGHPWFAFLRFDPDGTLAGRTVLSVELRTRVPPFTLSDSDQSGEVWAVEPFEAADLDDSAPDQLGGGPVAADQGPVALDETVIFPLLGLSVAASTPVFLGIFPTSMDSVDYENANGANPPTLIVTFQ